MNTQSELLKNITETDLELAKAYYPILIDVARQKKTVFYSELVDLTCSPFALPIKS